MKDELRTIVHVAGAGKASLNVPVAPALSIQQLQQWRPLHGWYECFCKLLLFCSQSFTPSQIGGAVQNVLVATRDALRGQP